MMQYEIVCVHFSVTFKVDNMQLKPFQNCMGIIMPCLCMVQHIGLTFVSVKQVRHVCSLHNDLSYNISSKETPVDGLYMELSKNMILFQIQHIVILSPITELNY